MFLIYIIKFEAHHIHFFNIKFHYYNTLCLWSLQIHSFNLINKNSYNSTTLNSFILINVVFTFEIFVIKKLEDINLKPVQIPKSLIFRKPQNENIELTSFINIKSQT